MNRYKNMSDEELRNTFVPEVYQPDIYAVDYQKLKSAGISLISFDVDDTIAGLEELIPPKNTIIKFEQLKKMGFALFLMSNNHDENRIRYFAKKLDVDYIAHSLKPSMFSFRLIQDRYSEKYHVSVQETQMAHIGNNIISDVGGGNTFGAVTCLVRRMGVLAKPFHINDEAHKLRKILKERDIWRKHHKYAENDQYYQLGEIPAYRK